MTQEFVTLPREVVEQAMSALEFSETQSHRHQYDVEASALSALSAALEQPQVEQEPVAWMHQCNKRPDLAELSFSKREPALAAKGYKARPLIFGDIAHPQPKREPLTDEQIIRMVNQAGWDAVNLEDGFGERIRRYTEILEAAHNK